MRRSKIVLVSCALTMAALLYRGDAAAMRIEREPEGMGGKRALQPHAESMRTKAEITIIQTHGAALPVWRASITAGICPTGATVVHVDKHDDMEPPQITREADFQRFAPIYREILGLSNSNSSLDELALQCGAHCTSACRCVLQNNNFITTAVLLGLVSHILWLFPDFPCAHCAYERMPLHECEMLSNHGKGDLVFRPDAQTVARSSAADGSSTPCGTHLEWDVQRRVLTAAAGASELLSSSRGVMRAREPRQYSYEARAISEAIGANPPHTAKLDGAWILDVDLDFLVTDDESPRMRNIWHQPGAGTDDGAELSAAEIAARFDAAKLARVQRWACDAMPALTDMCNVVFRAQLVAGPPPSLPRPEVARRLSGVEKMLRQRWGASRPPCAVTVARSLEGGYTPVAHARLLEEQVVAMVRRVFHGTDWTYSTSRTVNASVLDELSRRIEAARRSTFMGVGEMRAAF
jgi:hypothetical protein